MPAAHSINTLDIIIPLTDCKIRGLRSNSTFMEVEAGLRVKVLHSVCKAMANLARPVSAVLDPHDDKPPKTPRHCAGDADGDDTSDVGEKQAVRSAVKMYVLLLSWMASACEQHALKATKHLAVWLAGSWRDGMGS